MVGTTVVKNKLSQLNDKRFYFPHGIVSLPFHYPNLAKIYEFKQKKSSKNWKVFLEWERALV